MSEFLKGNYSVTGKNRTTKPGKNEQKPEQSSQQEFERRALEKLGGSIAFIAKPILVWNGDDIGESGDTAS